MSVESPRPDEDFLKFCSSETRKMFPRGWDSVSYPNKCLSHVLNRSSCAQRGRAKGGCRSYVLGGGVRWSSHQDFVIETLTRESTPKLAPSRVTAVETGGKWRIVSVADADMNILGPLHTAIYDRLTRFKWLLRGEATTAKFKDFTYRSDQLFVSGDYTSATDNLNWHVQRAILDAILDGTTWVPRGVKELAVASQSCLLECGDRVVGIRSGQLMGNLLSFPLLCIVNYLAFRWYGGLRSTRDLPVKINGDDIVFRGPRAVYERWAEGVNRSGLTLSPGKTLIDRRYFSLNSKMFVARGKGVKMLPALRSSAFGFRKPEDPVASLRGRWDRVRKDFPCGKRRLRVLAEEFLRLNTPYIVASRRSVTRGLDILVPPDALAGAGLWARECWYLSLEREEPLPLSPAMLEKMRVPEGWQCVRVEKVTKQVREASKAIVPEFISLAWSPDSPRTTEALAALERRYREKVALSPFYRPGILMTHSKASRLLGISPANVKRYRAPYILLPPERGECDVFSCPFEGGYCRKHALGRRDSFVCRDPHKIVRRFLPRGKRFWLPTGFVFEGGTVLRDRARPETFSCEKIDDVELELGAGTLWSYEGVEEDEWGYLCSPPKLLHAAAGCNVAIPPGGKGVYIGPPTCF